MLFINHSQIECVATVCTLCLFASFIVYCLCDNQIRSTVFRNTSEEQLYKQIKNDLNSCNEYLYFEINKDDIDKTIVFKFNENNAHISNFIYSLYGEPYKFEDMEMKYRYFEIEKYYENQDVKLKKIASRIRSDDTLKSKIITRQGDCIVLFTSDAENDLKIIRESLQFNDVQIDAKFTNRIIIPIKSNYEKN